MVEKLKTGLLLLGLASAFFWLAPHLPNFWVALTDKPPLLVGYSTAVRGRITGSQVSRQHHLYYLDGHTEPRYDFNGFEQPLTLAQQHLEEEAQHALGLGQQLETGDFVSKAANSSSLTVQRGDSTSHWFCPTPQAEQQAQQAAH